MLHRINQFVEALRAQAEKGEQRKVGSLEVLFRDFLLGFDEQEFLRLCLKDVFLSYPQRSYYDSDYVELGKGPGFNLGLVSASLNSKYIYAEPREYVFVPLSSDIDVAEYDVSHIENFNAFSSDIGARFQSFRKVQRREIYTVNGHQKTYRWVSEKPVLLLQYSTASDAYLRWLFDAQSMAAVTAMSSAHTEFQTLSLIASIGGLASLTSLPALEAIQNHSNHFIRWAALKAIAQISKEEGLKALHRAMTDKHPHIRSAARLAWYKHQNGQDEHGLHNS